MKYNRVAKFFENKIWSETNEKWIYRDNPINIADWRIVGSSMFNHNIKSNLLKGVVSNNEENYKSKDRIIGGLNVEILEKSKIKEEKENQIEYFDYQNEEIEEDSIFKEEIESKPGTIIIKGPIKSYTLNLKDIKKYCNRNITFDYNNLINYNLYIIEFESKRLDIGFSTKKIDLREFVILEADRGEDCGRIKSITSIDKYLNLLDNYSLNEEIIPKKILRIADEDDLLILKRKRELEEEALKHCIIKNYLDMEIVSCEYQWDMKKLTFFFLSKYRVDFRELVKDLYKTYKTRIWMCCVEKSKNWCLKTLIEDK